MQSLQMRRCIAATLLLWIIGCTPQKIPEPVEVKVPVAVSCGAQPLIQPDWRIPKLRPQATPTEKLEALLEDFRLSQGYIDELEAMLSACSG